MQMYVLLQYKQTIEEMKNHCFNSNSFVESVIYAHMCAFKDINLILMRLSS